MRRRVQEIEDRRYQRLEISARSRERRRPRDPIELRIQPTIIQRESVAALHSSIEGHLFLRDRGREEVETEHSIPDEVVLLAPRVRLIEGETIMVAGGG